MAEHIEHLESEGYILNRSTGAPCLEELQRALIEIETIHRETGTNTVLIDAREKQQSPSADDALEGGVALTRLSSQGIRFAVLVQHSPDRQLDFFENVVANFGGMLRFFTDKAEAVHWLRSGQP